MQLERFIQTEPEHQKQLSGMLSSLLTHLTPWSPSGLSRAPSNKGCETLSGVTHITCPYPSVHMPFSLQKVSTHEGNIDKLNCSILTIFPDHHAYNSSMHFFLQSFGKVLSPHAEVQCLVSSLQGHFCFPTSLETYISSQAFAGSLTEITLCHKSPF